MIDPGQDGARVGATRAERCPICGTVLTERRLRLRYESRTYAFDAEGCKRIFEENPDRFLDAGGEILDRPR